MIYIVIPTYNEKDNILVLIKSIESLYAKNKNISILVADDNSPDGTKKIVNDYIKSEKNIIPLLIVSKKTKTGLRDAYFNAFNFLIEKRKDITGVIQMDADLSHDPAYIKKHLDNLENGIDLSIGSRYVSGGGINNWGLKRILLSRLGNLMNEIVLSPKIKDYTGGFNGLSLKTIKFSTRPGVVSSSGYYFLTEMKYRILKSKKFRIVEFPIIFTDRVSGDSKMGKSIVFESIKQLIRIRLGKIGINSTSQEREILL